MALWETRVQIPSVCTPRTRGRESPMTTHSAAPFVPVTAMSIPEHAKGVLAIDDELYKAHAALQGGAVDQYKAHLQSAHLSLQILMRQGVTS